MKPNNTAERQSTSIKISEIVADLALQPRAEMNEQAIAEYAAHLDELPPIVLMKDAAGVLRLVDGWHRLRAHERAARTCVPSLVLDGERTDAVVYAAGANSLHGVRRTNADKRRAVEMLLACSEWEERSAKEVARVCRVSDMLVADIRRGKQVDRLEGVIQNLLTHRFDELNDTIAALREIRDGRGYLRSHRTFEDYLRGRFGLSPKFDVAIIELMIELWRPAPTDDSLDSESQASVDLDIREEVAA